ncbi:hypothetical protein [Tsuneonella mangrovi]|uniref:hypothetical protein n=1 Tax=Tsuneonella mangrovi TaxID=1982042 RepID=UPI000BA276DF|nr:hypothetical protein [Tsuneonella mangrovi]
MKKMIAAAAFAAAWPSLAHADPGQAGEVYGATVTAGQTELEARYGELDGGSADGRSKLKLEGAYGVNDRLRLGLVGEVERTPGTSSEFTSLGFEAIYSLGKVGPVDIALYGEYEAKFDGADKVESKLLMQHKSGPLDLRFNLIAEKELEASEPVELEYAASADVEAVGEIRLGVQAYGQLGGFSRFLPRGGHYVGPVAKIEIEGLGPETSLGVGYLFALGAAKDNADGQFRLTAEVEF